MRTHEIITKQTVTDEEIDDIMTTALEGGITYWCDQAITDVDLEDNYLSEMLTKGATIKLHDAEEDKWHELTLEKLLKAMGETYFIVDMYDAEDAEDADQVVQHAIFGEAIYG